MSLVGEPSLEKLSATHRLWVVPILEALRSLGGAAAPHAVVRHIRNKYRDKITDAQFANVVKNKHIQWTRLELRDAGLLSGEEYAQWRITSAGSAFLDAHAEERVDFSSVPPLAGAEGQSMDEVETVKVTGSGGYEIPVLRVLHSGHGEARNIISEVAKLIERQLLPGDFRTLPRGDSVNYIRINSAIGKLKSLGQARNIRRGQWEITDAGKERLEREGKSWDPAPFQNNETKVRALKRVPEVEPQGPQPAISWLQLREQFPELHRQLERRLRSDLGPTPLGRPIQRNAILFGPPGTGKTYVAKLVAEALTGDPSPGPDAFWRIVQFHPSYAYEDFVQGLRPNLQSRGARFELRPGPFVDICNEAEADPDHFYVLVIDEINRGDPARIFGELLYAIEYRDEPVDLALGGQLTVPPNLVLLGTMNSADRSVALVDYALRRRFGFIRMNPSPELIEEICSEQPLASVAASALQSMNDWLGAELDKEHLLGHSYFLSAGVTLDSVDTLETIWEESVRPLLEEYFYGDAARIQQATDVWRRSITDALAEQQRG